MTRRRSTPLRLLAALLALLTLPGWVEVFENVEHLIHDGHLAHSEEHVAIDPGDHDLGSHEETGCTPIDHHCGCCVSVAANLPPLTDVILTEPAPLPDRVVAFYAGQPSSLFLSPPLRPPIA